MIVGSLLAGCATPSFHSTWYFGRSPSKPSEYEIFVAVLNEGPDSYQVTKIVLNRKGDLEDSGYVFELGEKVPFPVGAVLIRPATDFKDRSENRDFPPCRVPVSVLVAVELDGKTREIPATLLATSPSAVPRPWEETCRKVNQ